MLTSILRTLSYADIFDYPLTKKELDYWLIGQKKITISTVHFSSPKSRRDGHINTNRGFYYLAGRQNLIKLRLSRLRHSRHKLRLARRVGEWLKIFPTIKLVAVTGALAMSNSDSDDDIDLMIITSAHHLWLTRLFVVVLLELLGLRRRPSSVDSRYYSRLSASINNKICLNLWLDTTALSVPRSKHNIYTAHEIAQIKLLWDKHHLYQQFLAANSWINHYLPNIKISCSPHNQPVNSPLLIIFYSLFSVINHLTFKFQYWYMRSKITHEKISPHFAFFHPRDTGRQVMQQYCRRLKRLGIKP